jgi:hypothetical protein
MSDSNVQEFARHPEYVEALPVWAKCRAAVKGERAVKALGEQVLPALQGAREQEYQAYKKRAMFYAASGRTVQGLTGMLLRKPPTVEPENVDFWEDVGAQGEDLATMLVKTLYQLLTVGRVGFLVDADSAETSSAPSPYVTQYVAENVINWYSERIDGEYKLTMVVLEETREEPPDTLGHRMSRTVFRVLRLGLEPPDPGEELRDVVVEADGTGFYWQEVWVYAIDDKGKETKDLILEDVIVPRRAGGALWTEIPFAFLNSQDVTPSVSPPPLEAMIDVNYSHYRNSADLEHGRHYTALPTPYAFGEKAKEPLKIGSQTAWTSETEKINVGMLEFTGAGLGHLAEGMRDKEQLMAVLGARLLEGQKAGVETADALQIRLAGDSSVMETISVLTSETWTTLMQWVQLWQSPATPNATVSLSTDFSPKRLSAQELTSLGQQLAMGHISWTTYLYNLQQGEILPPGRTEDEEFAAIQEGGPANQGFALPGTPDDDDVPDDADVDDDDEGDDAA